MKTKTKPKATSSIYRRDLRDSMWLYQWTKILTKLWKANKHTKTIISKNKWLKKTKPTSETRWGPKYLPTEKISGTQISNWASKWSTGPSLLVFITTTWKKAFRIKITLSINLKRTRAGSRVCRDKIRSRRTETPIRATAFNSRNRWLILRFRSVKASSPFFKFRR